MLLAAAVAALQVAVSPLAASRDGLVTIRVQGLAAPAASVVIHGGLASGGKMFGLVPLRDAGNGAWWTVLRAPGFYGVYPVRVRAEGRYRDTGALLRVLPRRFAAEPGVPAPAQVVEWWRRQAPQGVTIHAVSEWRAGFYFHRDQRYNRLLRVRFTLPAAWPQYRLAAGTQTRWFSVARLSVEGGWKLLELVAAP
jgi:hypothetical protein